MKESTDGKGGQINALMVTKLLIAAATLRHLVCMYVSVCVCTLFLCSRYFDFNCENNIVCRRRRFSSRNHRWKHLNGFSCNTQARDINQAIDTNFPIFLLGCWLSLLSKSYPNAIAILPLGPSVHILSI